MRDIERWIAEGKRVAVATVVDVEGSAPRPKGAKMVVTDSGEFAGSVSGGCVEGAVIEEAQEVLKTGRPKLVYYGIPDEFGLSVGLACGGTIGVYIEELR
jgi:xanthine/CO dehydrogenase XdhC/CoxF family maturation factor